MTSWEGGVPPWEVPLGGTWEVPGPYLALPGGLRATREAVQGHGTGRPSRAMVQGGRTGYWVPGRPYWLLGTREAVPGTGRPYREAVPGTGRPYRVLPVPGRPYRVLPVPGRPYQVVQEAVPGSTGSVQGRPEARRPRGLQDSVQDPTSSRIWL